MAAASGAISAAAKRATVSRSAAAVSPWSIGNGRYILYKERRWVFQQAFQALDHLRRILAVADAVVEAGGDIHHPPDDDGVIADYRAFLGPVDPEDGHLRTVDDRHRGQPPEFAETGDADGGA